MKTCTDHEWKSDESGNEICIDCGAPWTPPPPRVPKFYLCFLDFETTGLDPAEGAEPIEVAALITDDRLNTLGHFESLIAPMMPDSAWDPPALDMHRKSGLAELCKASLIPRAYVRSELARLLDRTVLAGAPVHLAGNSIHFDRKFLDHFWPSLELRFHHRHLDVSSLRIAGEIFTSAAPLGGEKPHRAMADVLRSIQELHHWHAALREP